MKKSYVVLLGLFLAGCQTTTSFPSSQEAPPPPASQPSQPHKSHPSMPPVQSAGPLTTAGVEVYMDAQEADLRSYLRGQNVPVARRGNSLAMTVSTDRLFDKAGISSWGDAFTRALYQVLGHYDHTAIEITCYTDASGSAEQNLAVSQKRAKMLADALHGYGIASGRMTSDGLGATNSRSTNPNDAKNRRIEIKITPQPK